MDNKRSGSIFVNGSLSALGVCFIRRQCLVALESCRSCAIDPAATVAQLESAPALLGVCAVQVPPVAIATDMAWDADIAVRIYSCPGNQWIVSNASARAVCAVANICPT